MICSISGRSRDYSGDSIAGLYPKVIIEGFSRVKIKEFHMVQDFYEVEIETITPFYSNTHYMQAMKKS